MDRRTNSQAPSLRALYAAAPVRVLASPPQDRAVANPPVEPPERRRSVSSRSRRGAAYAGAVVRISSSASSRACNAAPRPLCPGAPAHASGESARGGGDAQQATLLLFRARPLPTRAAIPTLAGGFAPAVAERRSAKTYRDDMRQLCRELLLPPKREWSRPPADVNHNKASLIPALWWRVVGNFVGPNTNFQMSRCSYSVAFLKDG